MRPIQMFCSKTIFYVLRLTVALKVYSQLYRRSLKAESLNRFLVRHTIMFSNSLLLVSNTSLYACTALMIIDIDVLTNYQLNILFLKESRCKIITKMRFSCQYQRCQYIEAYCWVENEDVVGAAPTAHLRVQQFNWLLNCVLYETWR